MEIFGFQHLPAMGGTKLLVVEKLLVRLGHSYANVTVLCALGMTFYQRHDRESAIPDEVRFALLLRKSLRVSLYVYLI